LELRSEVISITGPPEPDADEDNGARTLFTASLCFLYIAVRFLVAIEVQQTYELEFENSGVSFLDLEFDSKEMNFQGLKLLGIIHPKKNKNFWEFILRGFTRKRKGFENQTAAFARFRTTGPVINCPWAWNPIGVLVFNRAARGFQQISRGKKQKTTKQTNKTITTPVRRHISGTKLW
jgi:hypothetical protein